MAQSTTERRRVTDGEHEEIKAMITELKTLMVARAHIDEQVEKHDKLLNGNGVPGLKTDVQLIKDQLGRLNWAAGLIVMGLIADTLSRVLAK